MENKGFDILRSTGGRSPCSKYDQERIWGQREKPPVEPLVNVNFTFLDVPKAEVVFSRHLDAFKYQLGKSYCTQCGIVRLPVTSH